MSEPRDVTEVIAAMLEVIPEEEGTETLRASLDDIRGSGMYRPPEIQHLTWQEGAEALVDYFGGDYPQTEWGRKVAEIWTGPTVKGKS